MRTSTELQALGSKYGWEPGPRTVAQINKFSSAQLEWEMKFNKEQYELALTEPQAAAKQAQTELNERTDRIWAEKTSPEDMEKSATEIIAFVAAYPQFVKEHAESTEKLILWLKERGKPIVFKTLVESYRDLASRGEIRVSPKAIGAGPEDELTGAALRKHPKIHLLLEPFVPKKKVALHGIELTREDATKSASEWEKEHKHDWARPLSEKQKSDIHKAFLSLVSLKPDYLDSAANRGLILEFLEKENAARAKRGEELLPLNAYNTLAYACSALKDSLTINEGAVQDGHVTHVENLGGRPPGYPPRSGKYSFQKKIDTLSSKDYLERINQDSDFREAVDNLKH